MAKMFYGRVYFNVDQMRHTCRLTGTAPATILRSLGHEGEIAAEHEIVRKPGSREFLPVLPDFLRMIGVQLSVGRRVGQAVARIRRETASLEPEDLANLSDAGIWANNILWYKRSVEALQLVFALRRLLTRLDATNGVVELLINH